MKVVSLLLKVLLSLVVSLCCVAASTGFSIHQEQWMYKGHPIGYDRAGSLLNDRTGTVVTETPIVILNGFGVGSFHQHRLMEQLCRSDDRVVGDATNVVVVYSMDYLGQGRSWPHDCQDGFGTSERDLQYSGDLWVDQAIHFIEQVVLVQHDAAEAASHEKKVHLVGNSVGGHLAVFVAALRPDLVESITLLNATPVWGLNLPGWSGSLPAPLVPRIIGRYLFDRMRDFHTIRTFLESSYYSSKAYDEELVRQIRACTEGTGGHAAFASILWSPPVGAVKDATDSAKKGFYDCLAGLECDVLMIFGKDDPWCKPAFAKKMLQALDSRHPDRVHRYIELSNVGHCPNHEAPQAVARFLQLWTRVHTTDRRSIQLVGGTQQVFEEQWGDIIAQERQADTIPLGIMDRLATAFVG